MKIIQYQCNASRNAKRVKVKKLRTNFTKLTLAVEKTNRKEREEKKKRRREGEEARVEEGR